MVIVEGIVIPRMECARHPKTKDRFCAPFFEQHMVPLIPSWLSNNDVGIISFEPWANSIWEHFCLTKSQKQKCMIVACGMNTSCKVLVYFSMVLMVNLIFAFCSVKVPPTRAKSPKFTSSRRKSCSDTPQTPEGKNTNATSTRSHRHSIGTSKDANRVQCSPKSGVATKTRSLKPELKALWRAWSSNCWDCLCTNRIA